MTCALWSGWIALMFYVIITAMMLATNELAMPKKRAFAIVGLSVRLLTFLWAMAIVLPWNMDLNISEAIFGLCLSLIITHPHSLLFDGNKWRRRDHATEA